ncbi:MAG: cysteine--tRNA ligase [Minisyncoccia bacterium]|jgi:cysteinyl-tRNA synthetase
MMPIYLYNTLTRQKDIFKPLKDKRITLYTCGPTVYSYAHIGNLRTYVFEDLLKRVLMFNGFKVKHLMNITDVGHLTSDADTGEDKIEKEAQKEKKTAWEIAEFYTKAFFDDIKKLNIIKPTLVKKATNFIKEDIELIKALEKNGFTYRTSDGIYFDTSKLKDYGKLTGMDFKTLNQTLKAGSRVEFSLEKKNITDFSLWKFSPKNAKRQMEWESPWGIGFPGWHIECATLNLKFLAQAFRGKQLVPEKAQTIDIHCGGIDHIPIHHTNEIAQVEAVTKKPFVNFWLHGAFLTIKEGRMGKSEGNVVLLNDLIKQGFSPLSYRYFLSTAHYRTPLDFSFEALKSAQESLNNLYEFVYNLLWDLKYNKNKKNIKTNKKLLNEYHLKWLNAINDDLNIPRALSILWQLINDYNTKSKEFNPKDVYQLILKWDQVFGLDLKRIKIIKTTQKVKKLLKEREKFRRDKNFQKADEIRNQLKEMGYLIEDTHFGTKIKPLSFIQYDEYYSSR